MIPFVLAIFFGVAFTFFASQNIHPVMLNLAGYTIPSLPLYLVVLGSFFVALVSAILLASIDWFTSLLTLRSKESRMQGVERMIDKKNDEITQLREQVRKLSLENVTLKNTRENGEETRNEDTSKEAETRNAINRGFFQRFSPQI